LLYIGVGFFEYHNIITCIELAVEAIEDLPEWRWIALIGIAPAVLISISIGLTISVVYLIVQMRYHFDRRVMMAEEGRIRTIFLVFTLTQVSRTCIYLVTKLVVAKLINEYIIYYSFYAIWDVLPLTLIMVYHRTCYEAQAQQH